MKKALSILALAALAALTAAGTVGAQEQRQTSDDAARVAVRTSEEGSEYVPGELVVVGEGGPKEANVEVVPVEEETLKGLKQKAKEVKERRKDAAIVEPNYVVRPAAVPNDYHYPQQYHLPQIGAPKAWNATKGVGARLCVVDSGYDRQNPEFNGKTIDEYDFIQGDSTAQDGTGHGTMVAGIAGAETDNNGGTAGVGWDVRLAHARVFDGQANGTVADVARGLNFCQNVGGVSVVNMSLTFDEPSEAVRAELAESYQMGMTLVAAVGNDGTSKINYPAGFRDLVIGVGGTNPNGTLAAFSNTNASVDLVAPAVNIRSNHPANNVTERSGTSYAAPQVAGSASLLYTLGLDRDQVRSRLFNNAEDRGVSGKDVTWGHGFLNVGCATDPNATNCPPK